MSGLLLRSARAGLVTARRALPLSCTTFEPSKIERVEKDNEHGMLTVRWEDGIEGQYPYVWLQDCAPPPGWAQNYLGTDARPLPLLAEISLAVKPESVEILPIGQGIMVQWPPYNKVNYPSSWLRQHFRKDPTDTMEKDLNSVKVWDRKTLTNTSGIPTFEASVNISKYFGDIKKAFHEIGIVRIRHGNTIQEEISSGLGIKEEKRIPISAMCFTKQVNDLHTGVPFCDPIPNLAVLGFTKKPRVGQLQIVDGFMVAKRLRKNEPFAFRYLCTTNINYGNLDRRCEIDTASLINRTNQQPVFVLKSDGLHVDRVVFSNPCRASRQEIPPDTMHEFYGALKMFNNVSYNAENLVNIQPEAGDLFLIANDRILHGTTAFDGTPESQQITESFYYWDSA